MPKHKPIKFSDNSFSDEIKALVSNFTKQHPIASSAVKVVLATAIVGGAITSAAVVPGILSVIGKSAARDRKEKRERYNQLWARFYDLRKRAVFECVGEGSDGELVYRFTEDGKTVAKKFIIETLEISLPKRWDGKWRIVVFDIPEKYKKQRRFFLNKLKDLGFYSLQRSVLIFPFPCAPEIEFLKDFLEVKPYVETFVTNEMPNGRVIYNFRKLLKEYI